LDQDEMDEFDLLEMGSYDNHGLFEVQYVFKDEKRSARALKSLYTKRLIEFFWQPPDIKQEEVPLNAEESENLVRRFNDQSIFSNEGLESGFYTFLNTDLGDDFIRDSEKFQHYIKTEWAKKYVK